MISFIPLLFLVLMRRYGKQSLIKVGLPATLADLMAKAGPVFAVVVTTLAAWHWQLAYEHGVAVVGTIPSGLPALSFPWGDASLWRALLIPAMLISLVGFVESVSPPTRS